MGREDSSGSEDNNMDTQSVQFYLGTAPSAVTNSGAMSPLTPRTPALHQQHSPLELMNHIVNNNNHVSSAAAAAAAATSHSNNNDRYFKVFAFLKFPFICVCF